MCKKSTLINTTQQQKEKEKEEKTRTETNVWLSADIHSCPTNCTFSKIYLHEGQ